MRSATVGLDLDGEDGSIMAGNSHQDINLETGTRVFLQIDTDIGHFSSSGVVISMGSHAFRIRCDVPLPAEELETNQEVKLSLAKKKDMLPVGTRFLRVADDDPHTVVLQTPEGGWRRNRRSYFRAEIEMPVLIIRPDEPRIEGTTVNVSGGGALVASAAPLRARDEFQIIVKIPKQEPVGARGRVVWARYDEESGGLYGVKFIDINRRDQNRICRMVQVHEFEQRRSELKELTTRNVVR